jgi:pantetheine-phosphate adenylyltransferase
LTVAVYPGSFDPVTNGHLDIVTRAAKLFDKVVVGIFDAPAKSLLFSTRERVGLMKKAVVHLPNVEVKAYRSLTVEFARREKASVLVRGLRMTSDFEREFEMAMMNKQLAPDVELVCLMASAEFQFLSATLLKEAVEFGNSSRIRDMVPLAVLSALKKKLGLKVARKS